MDRILNFSVLLIVSLCIPLGVFADEINYGTFIKYKGKVNEYSELEGKGELVTQYNGLRRYSDGSTKGETQKDILEGNFSQGKVTDAKIRFARYNGPLWLNKAVFEGTLKYMFMDNNQGIQYTLMEGVFTCNNLDEVTISPENPLVITRIPSEDGCETIAKPINYISVDNSTPSNHQFYSMIGDVKEYVRVKELVLNDDWNIEKVGEYLKPMFSDGTNLLIDSKNNGLVIEFKDGDYFKYLPQTTFQLRKTYSDGVLSISDDEIKLAYADGSTYSGTTISNVSFKSLEELYKYYMKPISIKDVGLTYYTGELAKDGKIVKYIEGKTEAELLAEQERIKEEKAEEERWIKGQVAEKNNAIKLLCSKQYKAPNMKVNVSGFGFERNPVGLGGKTSPAVMKVYDFGTKGKTIALYAYVDLKDGSEPQAMCFSTSGRNLRLYSQKESGGTVYGPSNNLPFALLKTNVKGKTIWLAIMKGGTIVTDIYEGMSETALKMALKSSGLALKLVENSAGKKVYVLNGVKMDKRYYGFGENQYNYQVEGEEWGRFYFTNNKLTKWYFYQ